MASGYPVDMSRLEAAAPGRVGFVQKPFTPQALAEAVRRMLAPEKEDV
jgi:FixJ family two-component response regulator